MNTVVLSILCGVLAALALAGAARARPVGSASDLEAAAPALSAPRPGLYTSGQPGAQAWSSLARERGIATVINLRPDAELAGRDEAAEVRAAGLDYVQIPVAGAADVTVEKADALWRRLEEARGPVLVHCASGNRVGALLAIGAVRHGGMTPAEALAFGRTAGLSGLEARVRALLEGDARSSPPAGRVTGAP